MSGAWQQGLSGAALGGILGGVNASRKNVNFFTGKAQLDLSTGIGAHDVAKINQTVTGRYVGEFEGVSIYESSKLGSGYGSGGITLPGRGIVVGKGVFSRNLDQWLLRHEYGHILQVNKYGYYKFYTKIAPSSLNSASKHDGVTYFHNTHWTEVMANKLSYEYFKSPANWPAQRFPLEYLNYDWLKSFLGL